MADYTYFIEDKPDNYLLFREISQLEIEDDNIFSDTADSKEELKQLLDIIDYQDRLVVLSVVDLSDTATGLLDILSDLQDKGVILQSVEEPYLDGNKYYSVMQGFVDITRYYTEKRKRLGYLQALEKGSVGRPKKDKEALDTAISLYKSKAIKIAKIEELTGVSASTLYRAVQELKIDRD